MPGHAFSLGIKVYNTDGVTALSNVQVSIRNENTNDTKALNTNSSGEVVFQLGNSDVFANGWTVGDIVSYSVLYDAFQAKASISLTDTGGVQLTLTLVAITDAPSLRYFTVQEFLDTYRLVTSDKDPKNGLMPEIIVKVGVSIEKRIDKKTYKRWDNNKGDYATVTQELHNAEGLASRWPYDLPNLSSQTNYFTKNTPIKTLTAFEVNKNGPNQDANWVTLTEAANEITVRKNIGRIQIVDSSDFPAAGKDQVRITYDHGEDSVPEDIKRLAIIMTAKAFASQSLQVLNITASEAVGLNSTIQNLSVSDEEINDIIDSNTMREVRGI